MLFDINQIFIGDSVVYLDHTGAERVGQVGGFSLRDGRHYVALDTPAHTREMYVSVSNLVEVIPVMRRLAKEVFDE